MIYRRSPEFKKAFKRVPSPVLLKVAKASELFKENPRHPSLGIKNIRGSETLWEGRIDIFYRFTFEYVLNEKGETVCLFRNIGPHDIVGTNP